MAEIILDGRNISELKVTELKDELEKRGLPKKGVKTVLLNRLRTSILKELEVLLSNLVPPPIIIAPYKYNNYI